jgi:hypothetical protein
LVVVVVVVPTVVVLVVAEPRLAPGCPTVGAVEQLETKAHAAITGASQRTGGPRAGFDFIS